MKTLLLTFLLIVFTACIPDAIYAEGGLPDSALPDVRAQDAFLDTGDLVADAADVAPVPDGAPETGYQAEAGNVPTDAAPAPRPDAVVQPEHPPITTPRLPNVSECPPGTTCTASGVGGLDFCMNDAPTLDYLTTGQCEGRCAAFIAGGVQWEQTCMRTVQEARAPTECVVKCYQ